jgi:hypothetical protein
VKRSSAIGATWAQISRRGADGPRNNEASGATGTPKKLRGPNRGTLVSWGPPTRAANVLSTGDFWPLPQRDQRRPIDHARRPWHREDALLRAPQPKDEI